MEQRLSFITIAVQNLERMKDFYSNIMGWKTLKDSDGIVFYKLNGFILGLFPGSELCDDIGIESPSNNSLNFIQFTLAINYDSKEDVDRQFKFLKDNGVSVVREPESVFWGGYRGYFSDPENNYWEIAWNPFLELDSDHNVINHQ